MSRPKIPKKGGLNDLLGAVLSGGALFCVICGCGVERHVARKHVPNTQTVFDCKGCGKTCRKGNRTRMWANSRNVTQKKTGEPFEGGGL